MIQKLKQECGYQFTSKLEGMFMDMKVSADTQDKFRAANGSSKVESIDLSVQVLTTGFWPTQVSGGCNLPAPVARCCEVFREHYLKQHSGRRLQWQTSMGNADLKAQFGASRHEINVSTYMMCVLLLFNDNDRLSYADIARDTAIAPAELKRTLQSLACGKFKLLLKEPKGREVDESDAFSFNASFSSKQLRFKVGTVSAQRETEAEKHETRQKVDEDRKPQIEAAIVRIMKSRKEARQLGRTSATLLAARPSRPSSRPSHPSVRSSRPRPLLPPAPPAPARARRLTSRPPPPQMEHNALIADVTAQLTARFMPHPNVIKKRIESLIEREFLERDKNNWRMYKYLA